MDKLQAINAFWKSFGWPAYDENSVPIEEDRIKINGSPFPFLTYENAVSDFDRPVAQTASLWERATGWGNITAKEKQIAEAITKGGKIIHYDGGALIIRKGSPWAQRMASGNDDTIRRIILNYEVEYFD